MVSFLGLKAFADGSLGGHTAALRRPYADRPETSGALRLDPAWAAEMIRTAASLGGMTAVHAIGDAALGRVLDVFETAVAAGVDPAQLRMEHASLVPPGDVGASPPSGSPPASSPRSCLPTPPGWRPAWGGSACPRLQLPHAGRCRGAPGRRVGLPGGAAPPAVGHGRGPGPRRLPARGVAHRRTGAGPVHHRRRPGHRRGGPPGAGRPATFTVLDGDPVAAGAEDLRRMGVVATFVAGRDVPAPGVAPWKD